MFMIVELKISKYKTKNFKKLLKINKQKLKYVTKHQIQLYNNFRKKYIILKRLMNS
jgi:hypothetical protein